MLPSARQVLLVEDSPSDVRLFKEALREWQTPACVHVAKDGEEALDLLQSSTALAFDLILVNINVPKISGLELLRWIRKQARLQSVPVVVCSSSSLEPDIRRASEYGATSYLQKPTDLDEFCRNVAAIESCCSAKTQPGVRTSS